jgi:signal transduction histidine kinase
MGVYNRITDWESVTSELLENSASIALGVFTDSGKLLDANEAMCIFLDTTKEELSPSNFFVNPTFSQLINEKNELVFEGLLTIGNYSDTSYVLSSKIFRKKNVFFVLAEVDVKHLFEENKKMSDLNREVNNLQRQLIKEKKKLQNTLTKLQETQQMLVHSEKMNAMGQLVAGVAHEINNPISFVTNNIYSLGNYTGEIIESYKKIEDVVEKNASPDVVALLREIKQATEFDFLTEDIVDLIKESKDGLERVKVIVEDLRKFSRLDESAIKHVNLLENINSTLSIVRSGIEKKNIQFELECSDTIELECYPGQLNQAILNILLNAIYAVKKDGGIVVLKVEEREESVYFSVLDNGCGIAQGNLKKIFDPFFTTKPVGTGTGLGLSITYKIIHDLHKGRIDVRSDLERGTEVFFEISKMISV